ncbi:MAG: hypothetical protein ACLR78_03060 [Roseburia sp.]
MTSMVAGMVACNQTLATMLVDQVCKDLEPDQQRFAIDMENSVIVTAPLIPWSIAGAVPLASVSAPLVSIGAAVFLYLASNLASYCESQKGCLINFNFFSFG